MFILREYKTYSKSESNKLIKPHEKELKNKKIWTQVRMRVKKFFV